MHGGRAVFAPSEHFAEVSYCVADLCCGSAGELAADGCGVRAGWRASPAAGVNCGTSGLKLVDSKDPEHSLLLQKLTSTPPCGSPMPLGSGQSGLRDDQLACIKAFVFKLAGR
jgi:hypothetical protein